MRITIGQAYSFCQEGSRDYQEDSRYPDADTANEGQHFFLVCDGVGGCEKGEVASQTVCETFAKAMRAYNLDNEFTNQDFLRVLDAAYDALDKKSDRSNDGMATTMTFVCFHQGGCLMAHIGDSRVYQIRPGEGIIYRSNDHSLVNELVHNGVITPDEAINHPRQNVITRYMESVKEDGNRCMATVYRTKDVKESDYFFLCSDGVLHCVSDDELLKILSDNEMTDEEKIKMIAMHSVSSSDNNTAWLIPIMNVESDVIDDEEEIPVAEHETKRVKSPQQGSEDVEPVRKNRGNTFATWIKKVFS